MSVDVRIIGIEDVTRMLDACPNKARYAAETAIDYSVKYGKSTVQREMLGVFDNPTNYTINSVVATPTKGHNMVGRVGFRVPDRMGETYLAPQVVGGSRQLKGFERGLGDDEYVPASGAKLNAQGNVAVPQVKAAIADVKRRGPEYVLIRKQRGKLVPGLYQRIKSGRGFSRKVSRSAGRTIERGRSRGRYVSAILARGLKPIFMIGRTGHQVKPLLDFYGVAIAAINREFAPKFWRTFNSMSK